MLVVFAVLFATAVPLVTFCVAFWEAVWFAAVAFSSVSLYWLPAHPPSS
ncbi:hypothetical protein [uncultured Methanobrevibacter sp.]|nr:hypothetical protein [uncultured Methanobrevibacter sp.]